jgi:2-succinyl-6-hydroxy-2,4-cyclohexadiene-1-carboxylate synthase
MALSNTLNYTVKGEGYPVVFIHGFLENSSMWKEIIPQLQGIKTILIDLYGHGQSPVHSKHYSINELAEQVYETVKNDLGNNFSIVGHSLGGYVALEWANSVQPQPEKIVLLNSHPFEDSDIKKKERTQVAKLVETASSHFIRQAIPNLFRNATDYPAIVEEYIREANQMAPKGIADATIAMRERLDRTNVLSNYGTNLLVIQGRYDALIPFEKMQAICAENSNLFVLLEKAGHMAHIEAKENVAKELHDFLVPNH